MLTTQQLVQLFSLGATHWESHSSWRAPAPTAESIRRINRELGMELPQSFIEFSQQCKIYGVYLSSIGEDYDSDWHILTRNCVFHRDAEGYTPLPAHLVLINSGHDGNCDCFDTQSRDSTGEYPIVYWDCSAGPGFVPPERLPTFRHYLEKAAVQMARSIDEHRAAQIIQDV